MVWTPLLIIYMGIMSRLAAVDGQKRGKTDELTFWHGICITMGE